jgi:myo-inositol-hexaphosphate 3-phosphohydrolase
MLCLSQSAHPAPGCPVVNARICGAQRAAGGVLCGVLVAVCSMGLPSVSRAQVAEAPATVETTATTQAGDADDPCIWKYNAGVEDGRHITEDLRHDVEGLTIYCARDRAGYLIASSQGESRYVVYRREGNNEHVTTFRIVAGNHVDAARYTDGLDVTNVNLGPAFPQGVFVVHDGANEGGDATNYKLVPWQSIARSVIPMLQIDTSWNPRKAK